MAGSAAALAILVLVSWVYFFGSPFARQWSTRLASTPVPSVPAPAPPVEVRPVSTPLPALSLGAFHALVVGNCDYAAFRGLRTAVNDAEAVAAVLRDRYGFRVALLRNATRGQTMSALQDLRQRLRDGDNLLIYYAGHSQLDQANQLCYWLPVDAEADNTLSWISTSDVSDLLRFIAVKHLLVIADSCYGPSGGAGPVEPMTQEEVARALRDFDTMRARMVMTSGGMEPVVDGRGGKQSLFAEVFIASLEANDGVLAGRALFQRIQLRVRAMPARWTATRGPEYAPITSAGHEGGEFFFVRTAS